MIISPSRNFIFIHLEKCGGTSIENALQPYLAWYDTILGSTDFGEGLQDLYYKRYSANDVKKYMLWKHSTAKDIKSFLLDEWDEFIKISIVRNPEDLMKSLYFFSMTVAKYHVGRINRSTWKESLRINEFPDAFPYREDYFIGYIKSQIDGSGIDGFIDYAINSELSSVMPQTHRIDSGDMKLGTVIDLSELDNRWKEILNLIGIEEDVRLNRLNASERKEIEISNRSKRLIKRHFAIDYDVLPRYTSTTW